MLRLAGYPIPKSDVLDLSVLLRRGDFAEAADSLEEAVVANLTDVPLTIDERVAILATLDEPPEGPLSQLRAVLLQEHVGRVRDGLV